jgi:glutathione synthase/RimK-type ligase-like ATP-grasp enzyme
MSPTLRVEGDTLRLDDDRQDIVLVTCNTFPDLNASEQLYADALRTRGIPVRVAPWNGDVSPFHNASAIILRSNWDFHHDPSTFRSWLTDLKARGALIVNPPDLVLWNMDKHYLIDLQRRGVRVPESRIVDNDPQAIANVFDAFGWKRAVIKPTIGASGFDVELVDRKTVINTKDCLNWTQRTPLIVQEYLPELQEAGEISCIFFDGMFSHALLKRPAVGDFRVNSRYGGRVFPLEPSPSIVEEARSVLDVLDGPVLYARLDGVVREDRFLLTELEINEPDLDLDLAPGSAERFADATHRWLRTDEGSGRPKR